MRRLIFALVFTSLPLAGALAQQASAGGGRTAPPPGVEVDSLDRTADACTDFYQFACGGWIAKNPVPADRRAWGRFQEVQDRNFSILRRILETSGAGLSSRAESDRKKAADFYAACMDEPRIEAQGLAPIEPQLTAISALTRRDDLPALVARLHAIGVSALFRFGAQTDLNDATQMIADVDQGGLGLPDREYYLKTDAASAEVRAKYLAHVERALTLAGAEEDKASADAKAIVALETTLAEAGLDRVKRREPANLQHRMLLAGLQALTPGFNWQQYLGAAGAPAFDSMNVSVPEFMKAVNQLLAATPLPAIQGYLRWQTLNASADLLPKAFVDADFDFFSRTLAGQQEQQPRWRRCVAQTDDRLGEALGKAFVDEMFSPRAKSDALRMVQDIKAAMRQDIEAAPWMSGETKKAAMVKLDAVVDRIGYPDTWRDYSSVRVTRDDALGDRQRALEFNRQRALRKIGRAVDRSEWAMTPPTVNAYYSPPQNNINFPAGILQPPFYRADRDAAVNYGAAGAVIGHELTHGFDDQGRHYDGQGNLRDWWTAEDGKAFDARASCVADQYSGYSVAPDTHINGRLTLGENTADNGGVRLALMAYLAGPGARPQPALDGFMPDQRVFLGWAQVWCESARPEAERLKALTNPHASNKYRVNGPLSNMPEFQKAFSCKADAAMVRPNQCRVW